MENSFRVGDKVKSLMKESLGKIGTIEFFGNDNIVCVLFDTPIEKYVFGNEVNYNVQQLCLKTDDIKKIA